jgi:hypothetical protein
LLVLVELVLLMLSVFLELLVAVLVVPADTREVIQAAVEEAAAMEIFAAVGQDMKEVQVLLVKGVTEELVVQVTQLWLILDVVVVLVVALGAMVVA